ncbi:MAG: transposase [Candidatus Hydrogenedentes bacterium]|nr:transposase [Candidatus Hydrogenedentota bacterium]
MSQSLARIILHVVWSTKHRRPVISDIVAPSLYSYIGGILRECDSSLVAAGGMFDYVHLLCECSKNHGASKIVKEVKVGSSIWIKTQNAVPGDFCWQA